MPYVKANDPWVNADAATGGGSETTPLTAAELDHIEDGIFDAQGAAEAAQADADTAQDTADDHIADTAGAHNASAIASTTAAGITSTNVQDALEEIASAVPPATPFAVVFTALANEPPASSYAALDTRNSHPVLDFDASADEAAVFRGILPGSYGGGGLQVDIHWTTTSATSGNVIWEASIERIGVNVLDIDGDSFASAVTATAAVDATIGEVIVTSFLFSDGAAMDSLAAGEQFRLKILRDANNGSDTAAGDAELLLVVVTEQ